MMLIPVIDLLQGQVVRGMGGNRQAYRPINSLLCASSDPRTVARILSEHCDARQLYIADLDALMGGSAQIDVLRSVLQALPHIELWLDAGFADAPGARALLAQLQPFDARVVPVFGSESLASRAALEACFATPHARSGTAPGTAPGAALDSAADFTQRAVLSLDRRDGRRLDAAGCWDALALWPKRVIVMTMERVGSQAGPDLDTMRTLRRDSPATWLVGAGGVRNAADLAHATDAGADAWLVASALHDLQLPRVHR